MIEVIAGIVFTLAVINAAVDLGTKGYNYVEPKVIQGVEYIEEKLD